jgi:predicted nucleic acid-binding protein
MAGFLLDSDVLIWTLRKKPETLRLVGALAGRGAERLCCSAVSVLEVWSGRKPGEEEATRLLLEDLEILPADGGTAFLAGDLLRGRPGRGPRDWADALIAATAIRHELELVTYNTRDFPYAGVRLYAPDR